MPGPWIVVGLGNPGPEYAATRHNIGAMVVARLAERGGDRFRTHKAQAQVVETRWGNERVILATPMSYMNTSGGPVAGLCRFFGTEVERVIAVHDELDLDLGQLRVKLGGGDNGHNGLKSIRRSLGSGEFLRVRLGIGRPPGRQDPADYVLKPFASSERAELDLTLERAADACGELVSAGLAATQNAYND